MVSRSIIFASFVAALAAPAPAKAGGAQPLAYGGRLTGADGAPVAGPVDLKLKFFDAAVDGHTLGAEVALAGVALAGGVFQTTLPLDGAAAQAVFGGGSAVYVEVTDVTHGKTYPRQQFSAVPFALQVPVDGTTITFTNGELTVPAAPAPPSASATQAGYLSAPNWAQFNGAPQKSYVDGLNAAQSANVVSLSTGLAGANANVAGLSAALAADVANVASLSTALATTNANLTTTSANLAATNINVTAITNAALKKDGSVPLTNVWNVGSQDMTNTGNLLMAGSKVFGLSVATSDPANLTAGDIGKIWYNGGIKLWNGTSAQSLGIAGAGLMSINSLNSGTQTLSNAVTGTTPAWNSAGSTHTLNIPMASAGGTVTAGLISNGEWTLFNGKQNVLPAANAVTNGYLSGGDWTVFNAKQALLPPGGLTANGYLASADWAIFNAKQSATGTANAGAAGFLSAADWATFNAKQPAGSYVASTRNVNTNAPLTGGGSLASDLTLTMAQATVGGSGYLSSADWALFNGKDPARSTGALTETTSNVLSITGGTGAVIGAGTTIAVTKSAAAANGYLASADWLTFNGKQPNLGFTPVNKAGDTMTGTLNLPGNGLTVGTSQLVVSGGYVGIGSANPGVAALDVTGNVRLSGGVVMSGASYTGFLDNVGTTPQPVKVGSLAITSLYTNAAPANGLYVQGFVGIGVTNPAQKLQIGSIGASGYSGNDLTVGDGTHVIAVDATSTGPVLFTNSNFSFMPSGGPANVGVGTTNPTERVDLAGGNIKMGFEQIVANCTSTYYCVATCSAGKQALGGGCVSTGYSTGFGGNTLGCSFGTYGGDCNNGWLCVTVGQVAVTQIRAIVNCANIK